VAGQERSGHRKGAPKGNQREIAGTENKEAPPPGAQLLRTGASPNKAVAFLLIDEKKTCNQANYRLYSPPKINRNKGQARCNLDFQITPPGGGEEEEREST